MRFDSLLTPVSEAEPCGPDLDEIGDDDYLNFMMRAENQLPQRYLDFRDTTDGVPFDPARIDVKAEVKTIAALLEQSRDLRLLTLEARFQAFAGQIEGFSECVQAIASLVSTHWEEVHPKGFEGDFTLRQNTVSGLDSRATIVAALEYAPVLRDDRAGTISLRDLAIANGTAPPRKNERNSDLNFITETLKADRNRAAVESVHASVTACLEALTTIQNAFDEATEYAFSPDLDHLRGILGKLHELIEIGRPDLAAGLVAPSEAGAGVDEPAADSQAGPDHGMPQAAAAVPRVEGVAVTSQRAAAAALLAAEQYFGLHEPSSPALILIHQARMLVGKPFIAALEALMPESSEQAVITVDATFGFAFNMTKMRAIIADCATSESATAGEAEAVATYAASTRQEATAIIQGVSSFFRTTEPSSPIPILLSKADRFLNQNFSAILADILPKKTVG